MRIPSFSPAAPDDIDVYLVLDNFGGWLGRAWHEADEERTDRQSVIVDLMDGQYRNPVRVLCLNTAEGWSRDVSEELADEIWLRCSGDGFDVPPFLTEFVERHGGDRVRQLPLPLRNVA